MSLRVATYNVEWFFATSPPLIPLALAPLTLKAARIAQRISALSEAPHIIALQEVEDEAALQVLSATLLDDHKLRYTSVCGQYASGRTGQRVAFLYQPDAVRVMRSGSFLFSGVKDLPRSLSAAAAGLCAPLLEKNVWLECEVRGRPMLVVNVHLKAQYDEVSTEIRRQEAVVLQGLIQQLRPASREGISAGVIVCGDFNDFDARVEASKAPALRSGILERIRTSSDVADAAARIEFDSAISLVQPVAARASTVYGDLIDHVLVDRHHNRIVRAELQAHPTDTAETLLAARTSDHFPLMAWIE